MFSFLRSKFQKDLYQRMQNLDNSIQGMMHLITVANPYLREIHKELIMLREKEQKEFQERAHKKKLKEDPFYRMAETEWVCQIQQRDPNGCAILNVNKIQIKIPNDSTILIGTKSELYAGTCCPAVVEHQHKGTIFLQANAMGIADGDFIWLMDAKKMEKYQSFLALF